MKNRSKFITTIICMLIIFFAMVVSIYAATLKPFDVASTISFKATGIHAMIRAKVYGFDASYSPNLQDTYINTITKDMPAGTQKVWNIGNIMFSKSQEYYEDILGCSTPTIKIRIAISNISEYDPENVENLFINSIIPPNNNSNITYKYRSAYGILENTFSGASYDTDFDTLSAYSSSSFIVDEEYTSDVNILSLNSVDTGKFLSNKNSLGQTSWFLLDFYLSVVDVEKEIDGMNVSITLNLSNSMVND